MLWLMHKGRGAQEEGEMKKGRFVLWGQILIQPKAKPDPGLQSQS